MKPYVRSKLNTVFDYPYLQSLGKSLRGDVTPIRTWTLATKECGSKKWGDCQLMARNTLFDSVQRKSWDRGQEWGLLADELRPIIVGFVNSLTSKSPIPEGAREKVGHTIAWDIMLICFEHEYRDLVEPFFYIPILEPWYAAGHIPCGWDGAEFPDHWDGVIRDGRLMVF